MSQNVPLPELVFSQDSTNKMGHSPIWINIIEEMSRADQSTSQAIRLKGGADNEDDELHMEELDEPDEKPKPKRVTLFDWGKKSDKEEEEAEAPPPPHPESKVRLSLHYFKIVMLFVMWCLFTYFLMTSKVNMFEPKLLVVPENEPKSYIITLLNVENHLGVDFKGPFVHGDDTHKRKELMEFYLSTKVQQVFFDDNDQVSDTKDISKIWNVELEKPHKLLTARAIHKKYVFGLEPLVAKEGKRSELHLLMDTNMKNDVTLRVQLNPSPINKTAGCICGALVLLFLYVMIIWDIVNRTFASIIAATLSIGVLAAMNSRPSLRTIMSWVDVETLLLLFGMMILVGIFAESGVFEYLAVFAYKITKGQVWPLINVLCLFTVVMSAFLDNVTMMLLVTPVTIRLCEVTALKPIPILLSMVLFSNIGAAMTPVGDPPNVIIVAHDYIHSHNVNFGNFFLHMMPGCVLAMATSYVLIRYIKYRKIDSLQSKTSNEIEELRHEIMVWDRAAAAITVYSKDEEIVRETLKKKVKSLKKKLELSLKKSPEPHANYEETLQQLTSAYPIRNKVLLVQSSVAFTFCLIMFLLHSVPNLHYLSMGWTALLGALLLLLLADCKDIDAILGRVEWSTLLFFAALFILMEALSELGLIEQIGHLAVNVILSVDPRFRLILAILMILWVTAIGSAFLANIPVTTMMLKIVVTLAQNKDLNLPLHPLVWSLAFGACFGGNGTLIGASANVVCAGVAEQHGYKINFVEFFLVGFPVMLVSVVTVTGYLLVCHCALTWHDPVE